ncbi:hypothetical protein RSSE_c1866 [Ralstonia solanacearum]|nr:hypothetical protein RSSE_c1866 [Ralstonia solanacearum]
MQYRENAHVTPRKTESFVLREKFQRAPVALRQPVNVDETNGATIPYFRGV